MSVRDLTLGAGPTASKLSLTDTELAVQRPTDKKWPKLKAPLRNVLWAGLDNGLLEISLLARKKSKGPVSLVHITGPVSDADKESATAFTEAVMAAAYSGLPRQRRLKVFVNPNSGPGKAAAHYRKKIEPIFNAAKCKVDVTFTTRRFHAQDVVEKLPLDQFDAIVVMSGDGLIHEVLNGYANHADPSKAFHMPISPIPTGSGNALSINLIGVSEGLDISIAALNAVKGKPMEHDLFSMTQGGKRYITFMSQSLGLMANLDLGTEHLRFMGAHRFVVGFVYEVLKLKPCPVKVSIKVAHSDKNKMLDDMKAANVLVETARAAPTSPPTVASEADGATDTNGTAETNGAAEANGAAHTNGTAHTSTAAADGSGLPPLQHIGPDASDDGWITFDKPFTYLFAGKGPYVSADFVQFPVSLPTDGLIDVVLQERLNRSSMLKALDGAERGDHFWLPSQHYFKAHAYRIEPASPKGFLSIDGEAYPLEPYALEVHQGLGRFLSMYGSFQVDFDAPPSDGKKRAAK